MRGRFENAHENGGGANALSVFSELAFVTPRRPIGRNLKQRFDHLKQRKTEPRGRLYHDRD